MKTYKVFIQLKDENSVITVTGCAGENSVMLGNGFFHIHEINGCVTEVNASEVLYLTLEPETEDDEECQE